ncbi:hypothetical protein [Cyclobacterium marinum]|uniref:Uncharacterized protein n=1 Tax=Cyclobacterium marinum (strain ATCC 25205 / DSM 745 / LMG 13164 / NCIMB 1802) TaxID=880070 RepID=G0J1X4_CYCMS|nr:hypothetical protein [Cyclobacterium marinum]AEL23980.1 hypothetical protein Cycma_0197 [Cyclobacterium marinum DSM 745]MBI0398764.1 hypothetical protein [Cyclobacterium marinum]|tara:strand:- start:400 stop:825 length:426 start_codon:yes stop_codon:yes gene_type:complete
MISEKAILGICLLFCLACFGCITEEEGKLDINDPVIDIRSPAINQTYVAEWGGAWPEGEPVLLEAKGMDDVKVESIQVTISNSKGDIVLDKVFENLTDNDLELILSESFTAKQVDVYSVVFTVIDSSGNRTTSNARTFSYV